MRPQMGIGDLIDGAREGQVDAMDRLLVLLRPEIERLARGYADPRQPAESTQDVVQEAWVRAWQNIDQFQGAGSNDGTQDEITQAMFRAWVGQIVHRVGLNTRRAWKAKRRTPKDRGVVRIDAAPRKSAVEPPADVPSPSGVVGMDEEARRVREAVARLPDADDRRILELRFFDGLSLRQAASRLDISYDRVRRRYEASMRWLERYLGETDGE